MQTEQNLLARVYIVNDNGDLLEDNQLIHQWPIDQILQELKYNIQLDDNTAELKTNMLRELLRQFLVLNTKKTKQLSNQKKLPAESSPRQYLNLSDSSKKVLDHELLPNPLDSTAQSLGHPSDPSSQLPEQLSNNLFQENLSNIIVKNIKLRGRPRKTKRAAIGAEYLSAPAKIIKKDNNDLIKFLQLLVPESKIELIISKGDLIRLNNIRNNLNPLSDAIPGGFLKIKDAKNYFDATAYKSLTNAIKKKENDSQSWKCKKCTQHIKESRKSIECDNCWYWYHFSCVKIIRQRKTNTKWFCSACIDSNS